MSGPWIRLAAAGLLAGTLGGHSLSSLPPPAAGAAAQMLAAAFWRIPWLAGAMVGAGRSVSVGHRRAEAVAAAPLGARRLTLCIRSVAPREGRIVLLGHARTDDAAIGPVRLNWYRPGHAPRGGECWRLHAVLRRPRGNLNPGGWDFEAWLYRRGVVAVGYVRADEDNRRVVPASGLDRRRHGLNEAMAEATGRAWGETSPSTVILPALVTGERSGFDDTLWELLGATGTAHLVAISGLHVGLVALLAFGLLRWRARWLPRSPPAVPEGPSRVVALLAATAYAALAGFPVPARRALLMLAAWTVAGLLARRPSAVDVLALAMVLVLLSDPLAALDPGFWMSFTCVGVIAVLAHGRLSGRGLLSMQGGLWVALLVPTAAAFGRASLVAPVANLLAVPVFTLLVVPMALLGAVLHPISPSAAAVLWQIAGGGVHAVIGLLGHLAARLPVAVSVTGPEGFMLLWGLLMTALLIAPGGYPGRPACAAGVLLLLLSAPSPPPEGGLEVTILDVGQGLAVILRTRRHTIVYDTGPAWPGGDAGRFALVPALRRLGGRRVDLLVVSHPDRDHAGGADSVVAALPVDRTLAAPGMPGSDPCRGGDAWAWDGVAFRLLGPGRHGSARSDNDRSCVLLVETPGGRLLLPGDIGAAVERDLIRELGAGRVDLVVAAHHGSATSSAPAFVDRVDARWVVYAAGYRNRWGFPAPAVAARWRQSGAVGLHTGRQGALHFRFPADGPARFEGAERRRRCRHWRDCGSDSARRMVPGPGSK